MSGIFAFKDSDQLNNDKKRLRGPMTDARFSYDYIQARVYLTVNVNNLVFGENGDLFIAGSGHIWRIKTLTKGILNQEAPKPLPKE
jgi:hypothetical protein